MSNFPKTTRLWLVHSLYLVLTVFFIWFWTNNAVLSLYSLQLTGLLVVLYFGLRFLLKDGKEMILDVVVFTAILLVVLASTGGLGSPLFFLVYFLLFSVALLFDPPTTLTLTLALILFFVNCAFGNLFWQTISSTARNTRKNKNSRQKKQGIISYQLSAINSACQ